MRAGTNLGKMSSSRLDKISIAIIGILVRASRLDDAFFFRLGFESLNISDEQVKWLVSKIVEPKTLSSQAINDRLPEKYKLHTQQVTRLVKRMHRQGLLPGKLVTVQSYARTEFALMPESNNFVNWV